MFKHTQHPALSIGFDFFVTDVTVQLRLVEALDPGFADGLSTSIFNRIEHLGLFFIDTADVADRMGEMRTERIMTNELRLDIQARQAELIDRENGNLLFRQFIKQCHWRKRVTGLLHGFIEYRTVFGRQMKKVDDLVQLPIDISGALAGDGQVEAGTVIGEQDTVAVVDQAPCRRDRQDMHAVVFRDRRVVVEFHHLQDVQPYHQGTADGEDKQGAGDQPFVDQARFFFMILDRDRFRHFYSNSLT